MDLLRLLRYNSRHRLYHGEKGLELNPIVSRSHYPGTDRRTWSASEPLWLFRWRQRTFCFAGRQRCGRRDDPFAYNRKDGPLPDTWDWGPDGNRTCSYCGSAHPDDFMKVCRLSLTDERYEVHMSDKRYKAYITVPGVRNASEGAIKFYMQHAPPSPSEEDQELFSNALRVSRERFDAKWKQTLARRAAG